MAARTEPFRFHRGHMRLSTIPHIKAQHRRHTISEATAAGIAHFRLDVPRRWLGRVSRSGMLAPHLWRVRTLDEWHEISRGFNQSRRDGSTFDSLGFFHNDPSYVVPVPALYLDAAIKQGRKLRKRWLDGEK